MAGQYRTLGRGFVPEREREGKGEEREREGKGEEERWRVACEC